MTALLRLYPRAWRDRYGEEMERLLEDRPLDLLRTIDLVRGAIDARLHASMVPVTAGGGAGAPLDTVAARRRFATGPFLFTLAAGLMLISAAILAESARLPLVIGFELAGAFLAISSFVLGLAVMVTTSRGIVARLAGIVFASGIVAFPVAGNGLAAYLAIVVGALLLALGSLIERHPPHGIGGIAFGLAIALWISMDAGTLSPLVIGAFAIVPVGLALTGPGPVRPIVAGLVATASVAALIAVSTIVTSPVRIHDGFAVRCGDTETGDCLRRIDEAVARLRVIRPSDTVVIGRITGDGSAEICATVAVASGGNNPFDDPNWVARLQADPSVGLDYVGGSGTGGNENAEACWQVK